MTEFSLEGVGEFHDRFRVSPGSFERAMKRYKALAELQRQDPRLRIHATSCATDVNLDEIRRLTTYLFDRCPRMEHHNLVLIRGDRKNPSLQGPVLDDYEQLYSYIRRLWKPREQGRYGSIVEPMTQSVKVRTARERRQVVSCRAGVLSAVVYSNGDVSVCENHPPLGNLRQKSFWDIWGSEQARERRRSIARKECYCTNETFLWPSVIHQAGPLVRSLLGSRAWRGVEGLRPQEKVAVSLAGNSQVSDSNLEQLIRIQQP